MSLRLRDGDAGGGPGHLGELRLRRLRIGELAAAEADQAQQHLEACPACRARLEALQSEERAFSQAVPFARFAGGVERAARVPRVSRSSRRAALLGGGLAFAAAAGLMLVLGGRDPGGAGLDRREAGNRIKGGPATTVTVRIASADGQAQRSAAPGSTTALAPGERLRVGYALPQPAYLMAVSIDDGGEATKLSTDAEAAQVHPAASSLTYLPGSIELTGAGRERLYLFVSEFPLDPDSAADAGRAAHAAARGDLAGAGLPTLPPRVRAFTWLFEKP